MPVDGPRGPAVSPPFWPVCQAAAQSPFEQALQPHSGLPSAELAARTPHASGFQSVCSFVFSYYSPPSFVCSEGMAAVCVEMFPLRKQQETWEGAQAGRTVLGSNPDSAPHRGTGHLLHLTSKARVGILTGQVASRIKGGQVWKAPAQEAVRKSCPPVT